MLSRIIRMIAWLTLLTPLNAYAAGEATLWMPSSIPPAQESALGPVAIIYFNTQSNIDQRHAGYIQQIVNRAKNEFGLKVAEYMLPKEDELLETVDKIADGQVGLIVIVAPHNREAAAKIPSLYPDIRFTIIDMDPPEYYANGHSMVFKESEGMFLIGALAAWHSKSGIVKFCASEDNPHTRAMLDAFDQGARYAKPDVDITAVLGSQNIGTDDADIVFLYDEEHLQDALRDARLQKHLLITYDDNLSSDYPSLILTTLIKRYDLAIYTTLKAYQQNEWKPGSESLGISQGYLDYALSSNNSTLLSEDVIDHLETIKDLTEQGIIKIAPAKK